MIKAASLAERERERAGVKIKRDRDRDRARRPIVSPARYPTERRVFPDQTNKLL
jgi:hypothetical protein